MRKIMVARYKTQSIVRISIPLLSTESAKDFEARRSDFRRVLDPQNVIEEMHVDDIASQQWEMERLNRIKAATFNLNLRNALYDVFVEKLGEWDEGQETVEYLDKWFTDDEIKEQLLGILAEYGLQVSAIEAAAFLRSAPEWVTIDQLLAAAESARDRALRQFFLCREALAQQRQRPPIDAAPVARIESSRVARG
jgi:hypothetical protein